MNEPRDPYRAVPLAQASIEQGHLTMVSPKYIENTFQLIQSNFRRIEMHSKRRCKICICLVILGEL